jgi:flagellar motility protein MotE (MotC chaperone)
MQPRVRLLPVVIGAATVLLTLRFAALAGTAAPPEATEPVPASAHTAEATAGKAESHTETTPPPASPTPPVPPASPTHAQTKGEAEVLQQLSARRTALDERERNLAMREQLIGITEKRVEERLTELKTLEERLSAMLSARDEAEEKQLIALVKTYENMKPAEAARIFNRLDRQVLVNVASRMKPNKIGPVMAAMEPARAQDLTVMLALRLNVARKPAEAPVVAPQPVALPPNG